MVRLYSRLPSRHLLVRPSFRFLVDWVPNSLIGSNFLCQEHHFVPEVGGLCFEALPCLRPAFFAFLSYWARVQELWRPLALRGSGLKFSVGQYRLWMLHQVRPSGASALSASQTRGL